MMRRGRVIFVKTLACIRPRSYPVVDQPLSIKRTVEILLLYNLSILGLTRETIIDRFHDGQHETIASVFNVYIICIM